jgi:hypothetical protein
VYLILELARDTNGFFSRQRLFFRCSQSVLAVRRTVRVQVWYAEEGKMEVAQKGTLTIHRKVQSGTETVQSGTETVHSRNI